MVIKNRKNIQEFIIDIESQFDVNQWRFNDICLWPYLRISLYFYLIDKVEYKPEVRKQDVCVDLEKMDSPSFFIKIKKKTPLILKKAIKKIRYKAWILGLKSKNWLFVGYDSHRVDYKSSRFNRYFDTYISTNKLEDKYIFFECGLYKKEKIYRSENIVNFEKALSDYCFVNSKLIVNLKLEKYLDFLDYLKKNPLTDNFSTVWSVQNLQHRLTNRFVPKVEFFKEIFKKKRFKKIAVLCYYSEDMMAMLVAANSLKIDTIEMQHGPQTDIHMAYSHWESLPEGGYDMLPRTFWHWDVHSESVVKNWIGSNTLYRTKVVGNFWVDYWKNKRMNYPYKDFILYSLQTYPFSYDDLFPPNLINCIINSKKLWFIRLHPRQLKEKKAIATFLKEKKIYDLVDIDNATNDILPLVLVNAKFHVTNFSGTTLEASMVNVKTILLHIDGMLSFPGLIADEMAVYMPSKSEDFEMKFMNFINSGII